MRRDVFGGKYLEDSPKHSCAMRDTYYRGFCTTLKSCLFFVRLLAMSLEA